MEEIQISVRKLIEYVMRSGDIDNSYRSQRRMLEGVRAHQKIQKTYGEHYQKEVSFVHLSELEEVRFRVEGRADGLYENGQDVMIDEIKSTTRSFDDLDPKENQLHWAQAKCYAFFYLEERKLETIKVQLTYVHMEEDHLIKKYQESYSHVELKEFYEGLLRKFLQFSKAILAWRKKRDQSLKGLAFPYSNYRPGQRKLAVACYEAIEKGKKLYVEAPTGIGKTVSTIFPSLLSMYHLNIRKIFYLTARTTTQLEVLKALQLLKSKGLLLKSIQLVAKEKICLNEKVSCNPKDCPYAKGHFDRVNDAILELFDKENFLTREVVERYSEKFQVCPHEFQLDLSDYSDFVLCDYNYAFDPISYLRRAFDEDSDFTILLVDEAHNLLERGREMFSSSLSTKQIYEILPIFEGKKRKRVRGILEKMIDYMEKFYLSLEGGQQRATEDHPLEFIDLCQDLFQSLDPFLSKEKDHPSYDDVLSFSFEVSRFTKIDEYYQEGFVQILSKEKDNIVWKIQCLDTSKLFHSILQRVRSAIFFSATFSPLLFYQELLGADEDAWGFILESPFPKENLSIHHFALSVRYRDRQRNLSSLVDMIYTFVSRKKGNYMVFFPSYAFLREARELYEARYGFVYGQEADLTDKERKEVLDLYQKKRNMVGFFVLGGIFSEGIDLKGESLIGCALVSVGLPSLSYERKLMKDFYDKRGKNGFDYAYIYPGMMKVIQAAGRLIRSETDRGQILLIDDRFSWPSYQKLLPSHWQKIKQVVSRKDLEEQLDLFNEE